MSEKYNYDLVADTQWKQTFIIFDADKGMPEDLADYQEDKTNEIITDFVEMQKKANAYPELKIKIAEQKEKINQLESQIENMIQEPN